jgi:hypothetical protein
MPVRDAKLAAVVREIQLVLTEFGSDPGLMAAEIVKLREQLRQARLDAGISRARRPPTITPPNG